MRTLDQAFILAGLLSLCILIGISSCEHKSGKDTEEAKKALESTIEKDVWRVTYFYDGDDRTDDFNGATFQFFNNGGIIASWNNSTVSGIWTAVDARNGDVKFNLLFDNNAPFLNLDQPWVVVERTPSRVSLEASNGQENRLTLEKV